MGSSLERLIYRSEATGVDPRSALEHILGPSIRNNARQKITGALGFSNQTYVQLLEGSAPALDMLLETLKSDRRHTGLTVLLRSQVVNRLVPAWSMARVDLALPAPKVTRALEADDGLALMNLMATLAHEGITETR